MEEVVATGGLVEHIAIGVVRTGNGGCRFRSTPREAIGDVPDPDLNDNLD